VPKIKTHKSTAKRFTVTGTGKYMRLKGRRSHLRRKRAKRALRAMDRKFEAKAPGDRKRLQRLVPYLE
jgi:large subunit ribosomal protein L35